MERLTAEDQLMLWPDEIWPQDIGALAVLDGSSLLDADGRFRIEAVREAVAGRLHLVPRFRQRLYVPPRRLGGPLWVDAANFVLSDHVAELRLPEPGDEAQLVRVTEQLRRRRLDRSRPLWEMWFLTGLADGRVGLFVRMHHAIADGMAGVATIAKFLDATANAVPASKRAWIPAPVPTEAELFQDTRRQRRQQLRRRLSSLKHPVTTGRQSLAAWPAMREIIAGRPLPVTSLDRRVGPDRALALIRGKLEPAKEFAHTSDATVNDVLLTVTAGGLRRLLNSRGEPVEQVLRIYVPVSLHHEPRAEARGNLIGQMVVSLPIEVSDPVLRLGLIAKETAQGKARSRPSLGIVPHRGIAGRAFLKLVDRQRVNLTSADIRGPEVPQYFAGARLVEVFPLAPLIGKVSLAVAAMSYAGQFNITVIADRDAYPDLDIFVAGVQDELGTLAARTSAKLKPAQGFS